MVKSHSIPMDNVALAVDTGMGAFRTLKLPFSDNDKINEVIKFELESELPQWNIDDVVVDFMPIERTEKETTLLVSAVPKLQLERVIELCTDAGIEPLDIELEATAMVNAALSADICHVDDAQILVHVGEFSTSVVVVDAGKVRSVRAIHIGALSHDPRRLPIDGSAEGASRNPQEAEEEEAAAGVTPEELQRRLENAVSRIRRELGRTPRQQLIWLRVRRAAELLAGDARKIASVAAEVGYENPFVFSTVFKRCMGWPPSEHSSRI